MDTNVTALKASLFIPVLLLASLAFTGQSSLLAEPATKAEANKADDDDLLADDSDDLLADDSDDLLANDEKPETKTAETKSDAPENANEAHEALFLENKYPSATTCRTCHPSQYRQWSVSQHSYAQLSPVFNAMHGKILKLTNGTNGDFCIRCHTPVGMNLGEPLFIENSKRHPTSREGVTCITCHRVSKAYGIVSGRLAILQGDIFDTVYGPTNNKELKRVIDSPEYQVNEKRGEKGRAIHANVEPFFQLTASGSCGTCHDVRLVNGFRLEDAFSEFKSSPSAQKGQRCQDCHMSTKPGIPSEFDHGPAAVVGGVPTKSRKLTNHMFPGPDYSIVHPGIFPHNSKAAELASIDEWLTFDYEAGWGTDAFEDAVSDSFTFPARWQSVDDRYDAREILNEQFKLLKQMNGLRHEILKVGYRLGEVKIERSDRKEIRFEVEVKNGTDGHGVPTGFDAERLVWLHVTVTDANGKVAFESGDLDPNGDVRDLHSAYVHNHELPLDRYLFSLQSKFLTRNIRGGEREQVLAINYSADALPFLRPESVPTILKGRPSGARKHKMIIPPAGNRWAQYKIGRKDLTGNGPYTANIKLMAGMVPVNLINEIKDVGFDFGMSPKQVAHRVVHGLDSKNGLEGHQILWEREVVLKK